MIGTSYHNLDAKGRLAMPAKLRQSLGEQFYITIGRNASLIVYSVEDWMAWEEKFKALPYAKSLPLLPLFTAAVFCEPDAQGRILLSPELREYAHLTKEVAVLGAASRVELRDGPTWRAEFQRQMQESSVFAAMEELDF